MICLGLSRIFKMTRHRYLDPSTALATLLGATMDGLMSYHINKNVFLPGKDQCLFPFLKRKKEGVPQIELEYGWMKGIPILNNVI